LLKWTAENGILLKKKFFCQLSITLMEIYCHFLPSDLNAPKHTLKYHRAFYLKHAQEVIFQSPTRMSRKDIYDDPRMQNALNWIRKCGGKYSPRTIKNHWLKRVDPCKKGRPRNCVATQ